MGGLAVSPFLPNADFDEEEWLCPPIYRSAFAESCARGRERLARSSVVLCGLARDLGEVLPYTIARLVRTADLFAEASFVIYENDSRDDTRARLRTWEAADSRVTVLSHDLGHPRWGSVAHPERARQLGAYREEVRRFTVRNHGDADFALVADLDLGGWSYEGLEHTLGQDGWDAVGANGLGPRWGRPLYWDAWAFRALGHPAVHSFREVNMMVLPRGAPLVPVLSCFGGLALYRMEAMKSARYGDTDDCEHVTFHERMGVAGFHRIFLNPSLVTLYPDYHLTHPVDWPFWWRRRAGREKGPDPSYASSASRAASKMGPSMHARA